MNTPRYFIDEMTDGTFEFGSVHPSECEACHGRGEIRGEKCPDCEGRGGFRGEGCDCAKCLKVKGIGNAIIAALSPSEVSHVG